MQFFTFDLGEFLSYVVPGFLLVLGLAFIFPIEVQLFFAALASLGLPEWISQPAPLLLAICLALAGGHFCSVWRRQILSPALNTLFGRAGHVVLATSQRYSLPSTMQESLQASLPTPGQSLATVSDKQTALKLMELVLAHSSPSSFKLIEHHVRARSLCGNLTLPLIVFGTQLLFLAPHNKCVSLAFFSAALVLAWKYRDLDLRQARDTSLAFFSLRTVTESQG